MTESGAFNFLPHFQHSFCPSMHWLYCLWGYHTEVKKHAQFYQRDQIISCVFQNFRHYAQSKYIILYRATSWRKEKLLRSQSCNAVFSIFYVDALATFLQSTFMRDGSFFFVQFELNFLQFYVYS